MRFFQFFFFSIDIKALAAFAPDVVSELRPAFEKYNEEQLVTVKLPGSSQPVRQFPQSDTRYLFEENRNKKKDRKIVD